MTIIRQSPSGNPVEVITPSDLVRLSNVVFVDGGTTIPTAQQNGTILRPFATITQALAVANPGRTIQATAGDYSGEGVLNLRANLQCWQPAVIPLDASTSAPRIRLAGISQSGGGASIVLQDVECPEVAVSGWLTAIRCFLGDVVAGPVRLTRCATLGPIEASDNFESVDCSHENLALECGGTIAEFRGATFLGAPTVEFTGSAGSLVVDDMTAYTLQSALAGPPVNGTKVFRVGAQQFARLWVANAFVAGPPAVPGVIYNQTTPIVGGAQVRWDVPIVNRQYFGTNWFELTASAQGPLTFVGPASVAAPVLMRIEYQLLVQLLATKDVTGWSGIQVVGDPTPRGGIAQHRINGASGDRFNLVGHGTHGAITGTAYWPSFRAIAGQSFAANEIGVNDLYMGIQWQGTQPI